MLVLIFSLFFGLVFLRIVAVGPVDFNKVVG